MGCLLPQSGRVLWRRHPARPLGNPSTPAAAFEQIDAWRQAPSLRILRDTEDNLDLLKELALEGSVIGAMIHDARVASCCLSHGIDELWSVDRNFSRFPRLRHRNPLADLR